MGLFSNYNKAVMELLACLNNSFGDTEAVRNCFHRFQRNIDADVDTQRVHHETWPHLDKHKDSLLDNEDESCFLDHHVPLFEEVGLPALWKGMHAVEKTEVRGSVKTIIQSGALIAACKTNVDDLESIAKTLAGKYSNVDKKDFPGIVMGELMNGSMKDKLDNILSDESVSDITKHLPTFFQAQGKAGNIFKDIMELSTQLDEGTDGAEDAPDPADAEESIRVMQSMMSQMLPPGMADSFDMAAMSAALQSGGQIPGLDKLMQAQSQ